MCLLYTEKQLSRFIVMKVFKIGIRIYKVSVVQVFSPKYLI